MSDPSLAQDIMRTVTLQRRRGDAAFQRDRNKEAKEAWEAGLAASDDGFAALGIPAALNVAQARGYAANVATEAAELMGVRGGLLRRLGRTHDALDSYRNGAVWETSHNLPQTYNRTNAFKLAIIVGDRTLAQLHEPLSDFRHALEQRLSTDERAADDAWLWADLGDVRLLLGDESGAASAYQDFVTRARSDSPVSSLAVLHEVVQALISHKDPDANRTAGALAKVESVINAT
jgi:tetratricopeptide (TPR) repeat protein